MNVQQLIDTLSQLDPDAPVFAEGCTQCVNPATGVTTYDGSVWIEVDAS